MECSVVVPRLRRGDPVDAVIVVCVTPPFFQLGWRPWVPHLTLHFPPAVGVTHAMVGLQRGVATSNHVWPAIPGLPGLPLRTRAVSPG